MSREEKLNLAQRLKEQRSALFAELGIDSKPPPLPSHVPMPHLVALAEPTELAAEPLTYYFRQGLTWIGSDLPQGARLAPMEDEVAPHGPLARLPSTRQLLASAREPSRHIVLTMPNILPKHARVVRSTSSALPSSSAAGHSTTIYAQPGKR